MNISLYRQVTLLGSLLLAMVSTATAADLPEKVTYDDHIKPIFRERCLACHDQDGKSGDLALDSYAATIAGGASGEVVVGGSADDSRLYKLVTHADKPIMPPDEDKLPDEQLALVKAWIDGGLLENAGSKAIKKKTSGVAEFTPSADNRPAGEPAMPSSLWREPVVHAPRAGAVGAMAASPWAPLVAIGGQRQVLLYHTATHELLGVIPYVVGAPQVVKFSRNGDLLLVAGGRGASLGVVDLWDVKTGRRIARIGDEVDAVLAADISPDHSLVALGGPRKRVKVFRTADGSLAYDFTKHTDWVTALEFSPNGKLLITADRGGNAYLWEAPTGRPVAALAGHTASITSVSWRGDSGVVATASEDASVRLWAATGGNAFKNWAAHGGGTQWVSFLKDGRLVTAGRDRQAKLWTGEGAAISNLHTTSDLALAAVATFDSARFIVSDWNGNVTVVEATDPKKPQAVAQLSANPPTLAMRIEAARAEVAKLTPEVAPIEAQLAKAEQALAEAQKQKATYDAQVQEAQRVLAERTQQQATCEAKLQEQQGALAAADRAIAEATEKKKAADERLATLRTELASLEGQQGEGASAERAAKLEEQVAAATTDVAAASYLQKVAEEGRPALEQAVAAATQEMQQAQQATEAQQKTVADMQAKASQLPPMDKLVAERDRLQGEVKERRERIAAVEAQIVSLEQELTAYRGAQDQLAAELASLNASAEQLSASLAEQEKVHQQDTEVAARIAEEVKKKQEELAKLEEAHKQAAAVAQASQAKAEEVSTQLDTVSQRAASTQRALEDLKAVAELQNGASVGD